MTEMELVEVDVREVSPRERHPMIFAAFDDLQPGGAFILVNDHDPLPLYYQFEAERPGQVELGAAGRGPRALGDPHRQARASGVAHSPGNEAS